MNKFISISVAGLLTAGAWAEEKLPTGYGNPANDLASGSVAGLSWSGAARAYRVGGDVILVFTDTTAGVCSFEVAPHCVADVRYLLVGGGGPGGFSNAAGNVPGGGGAGGMVTGRVELVEGRYAVTVGAGGVPVETLSAVNNKGGDSAIYLQSSIVNRQLSSDNVQSSIANRQLSSDNVQSSIANRQLSSDNVQSSIANRQLSSDNVQSSIVNRQLSSDDLKPATAVAVAYGGGGGGMTHGANETDQYSVGGAGGSGGGAAVATYGGRSFAGRAGGAGVPGQGHNGGASHDDEWAYRNGGGGGGAGAPGQDAPGSTASGNGGDGLPCDITGEVVWYAGGGAGGAFYGGGNPVRYLGGKGGGGESYGQWHEDCAEPLYSRSGTDTLGGGGAGASGSGWIGVCTAGCGGSGVVVVRVATVYAAEEPLPGVSFEGAAEWHNVGHGAKRETVIVYTNVNAVGTLKLSHRAKARVLLVGGGGAGGFSGAYSMMGGGGGAGGVVSNECVELKRGVYEITVGKGGLPSESNQMRAGNGGDSVICRQSSIVNRQLSSDDVQSSIVNRQLASDDRQLASDNLKSSTVVAVAYGGGAGGNPNGDNKDNVYANPAWGANGGCGGGGATYYHWWNQPGHGGAGSQGGNGGQAKGNNAGDNGYYRSPGGGGGAGEAGQDAPGLDKAGAGGSGIVSDITGSEVWYAGGGAGGTWASWGRVETAGGLGGGGRTWVDAYITPNSGKAEDGADGFGGGGGGASGGTGSGGNLQFNPGRGGNGVVIVRITKVACGGLALIIR